MFERDTIDGTAENAGGTHPRRIYRKPALIQHGSLHEITLSGGTSGNCDYSSKGTCYSHTVGSKGKG